MVAGGRRIAGQAQHVSRPEGPRPQQVARQAETIPVAARDLGDRLEACRRHQAGPRNHRHVRRCRGGVGDVDGVRVPHQPTGLRADRGGVRPARRHHFGGHAKHALMDQALHPAVRANGHAEVRSAVRSAARSAAVATFAISIATVMGPTPPGTGVIAAATFDT